jgi:tRNA(His) guanylyltransferase
MNPTLGNRMKGYESASKLVLPRRMPVIIRLDGKAFHTWTKQVKCQKPFDEDLSFLMAQTCESLVSHIQGCVLAYTQSDEISLLLHNYKKLNSDAWFDNQVQKMVSVAASVATATFNYLATNHYGHTIPFAFFDARVFVLPEAEVVNYFVWRQQDATRNSISALAQSMFSHKELQGKSCQQMQDICFERGVNWNNLPTTQKRGCCVLVGQIDGTIPVFSQDRGYIENLMKVEEY